MSRVLSPPPTAPNPNPSPEFGPGNAGAGNQADGTGSLTLPAPAQPPSQSAIQDVQDVMNIVTSARGIADRHPTAVPIVKQINDLVQQLQMAITQSLPPTQTAAPPV